MNTKKKIEQCLHSAPAPQAGGDLLGRLKEDVSTAELKTHRSAIRRWFAPTGQSISLGRVAAAAVIAIVVMLPLSYGAVKVVKFITEEFVVTYNYDYDKNDGKKEVSTYVFRPTVKGDCINSEEDAKEAETEMLQLIKEGKAEEVSPGHYRGVLSNGGEVVYDTLGIPIEILQSENREEKIKEMCNEIEELKTGGDFERTFLDEVENNGIRVYIYKECYTLSNGTTITLTSGYGHKVKDKTKE